MTIVARDLIIYIMIEAYKEFPKEVGETVAERIFPGEDNKYAYSYTMGGPFLAAFTRLIVGAKIHDLSRGISCLSGRCCMEIPPDVARTSAQTLEFLAFGVEVAGLVAAAIALHDLYILGKRALLQGIGAVAPPRIRGS